MQAWPRSLGGRVAALLVAGMAAAYGLSAWMAMVERTRLADAMMLGYFAQDVSASVAMLDRLPAAERAPWLQRLARPHYRFQLEMPGAAGAAASPLGTDLAAALTQQLGPGRVQAVTGIGADGTALALRLADGTPLTLLLQPPVPAWPAAALWRWGLPALLLAAVLALAVRMATRPLARLADAAQRLGDDPAAAPVVVDGPLEVRRAATALNAMRDRIAAQMNERLQILAAVSHDLRAPITRMRLRCELLPQGDARERLLADLDEMQHLVEEGLALAASEHAATEPACAVDLVALLDTLACDLADAGRPVDWTCTLDRLVWTTRPQALRRAVGNLLDNALKFAGTAELRLEPDAQGVCIAVRDRGPGIAPERLAEALQPFSRLEPSRNRDSGGTGLGLAITQRLAQALGAQLVLRPRPGGGLDTTLQLPPR